MSHFYFKISDDERRPFFKEALQPCLQFDTSIIIVVHLVKHAISQREVSFQWAIRIVCLLFVVHLQWQPLTDPLPNPFPFFTSQNDVAEVASKWTLGKMSLEDFSEKQKEPEIKELFRKHVSSPEKLFVHHFRRHHFQLEPVGEPVVELADRSNDCVHQLIRSPLPLSDRTGFRQILERAEQLQSGKRENRQDRQPAQPDTRPTNRLQRGAQAVPGGPQGVLGERSE